MAKSSTKRVRRRLREERVVSRFSASTGLTQLSVIALFRRLGPSWVRNIDFRIES